jgi:hypothetical protein
MVFRKLQAAGYTFLYWTEAYYDYLITNVGWDKFFFFPAVLPGPTLA